MRLPVNDERVTYKIGKGNWVNSETWSANLAVHDQNSVASADESPDTFENERLNIREVIKP